MGTRFFSAVASLTALVISAGPALGQSVISVHSGLLHYIEGQVLLDDKAVEVKYSQFPEVRVDQVLRTEDGRAEVLLTPGVFLRLAEGSSFRMLSNKLTDTQVEALSGSVMIEHGEMAKDNQVTLLYKDKTISFLKSGLYRLDADNGTFRVYQGEARVLSGDQSLTAKQAREVQLAAAVLTAEKFDNKIGDEFYRWASRRAGYLALANVSAAKSVHDSGFVMSSGMWRWNPWFGMFTYIPMNGYYSPFGYSYWTPQRVVRLYQPGYYGGYYGGGGYNNGSRAGNGSFNPSNNGFSNSMGRPIGGGVSGASPDSGAGPSVRGGGISGGGMSGGGAGGGAVSHAGGGRPPGR